MALPSPVKAYHTKTYAAIDPTLPALSQKGQNVFITGASQGIGREMALSFARANVSNLAILGRKKDLLQNVHDTIKKSNPDVSVHTYIADLTDRASVDKVFSEFASAINGPIHTLVANAGYTPGFASAFDASEDHLLKTMTDNLGGLRNTYRAFIPHISKEDLPGLSVKARIIHTSTGAAHTNIPHNSSYSIAKLATAKYMEFVAAEHPDVQVIGFHPGLIKTQMAEDVDEEAMGITFDDKSLPADWAVWAASSESKFLGSGRLVWAHWDIAELKELFAKYTSGEVSDGIPFGPFHLNKNFTLGLISWP